MDIPKFPNELNHNYPQWNRRSLYLVRQVGLMWSVLPKEWKGHKVLLCWITPSFSWVLEEGWEATWCHLDLRLFQPLTSFCTFQTEELCPDFCFWQRPFHCFQYQSEADRAGTGLESFTGRSRSSAAVWGVEASELQAAELGVRSTMLSLSESDCQSPELVDQV